MGRIHAAGILVVVLEPASDDRAIGMRELFDRVRFGKTGADEKWDGPAGRGAETGDLVHVGRLAGGIRCHHQAVAALSAVWKDR